MSRIFISHSSANNAHALALARWLEDNGWSDYFLDVEPERGLAPGERWQEALKQAAHRCEAVLFLISPAWRDSRWCLAEFLLARQLGKTAFGVLVEETALASLPREMTAEWQICDLVSGDSRRTFTVARDPVVPTTEIGFAEAGLSSLGIGLRRAGLDPSSFPWPPPGDPTRAPYPGLRALEAQDAPVFFGREAAIVRGLDTLRAMRDQGTERLFVILGASGSGKSSFLRAGLWPRLARDDRHFLTLPVIRPERGVLTASSGLVSSLDTAFRQRGTAKTRASIRAGLADADGLRNALTELRGPLGTLGPRPTALLCIDQGEELASADGRAEAEAFLRLLARALQPGNGDEVEARGTRPTTLAIVAIRSDSYERLQVEPSLEPIASRLFSLAPIARSEFKAVIEGPAARATAAGAKLAVEPALTERLLQEAEGADALPLLAFTLERLYVEAGGDGDLRLDQYELLGGIRGSIEAAVNAAFQRPTDEPAIPADKAERERRLRGAFVPWLAGVDPQTEERKRRVARWGELPVDSQPLVERLVAARLLVRDRRRLEGRDEEEVVVEVAHEALLRQWPTLTAWLDADADALKALEANRRAAAEWAKNARGEAWLVHAGERLTAAEGLRARPDFDRLLGAEGLDYLRACRQREDTSRQDRQAQLQRVARAQRRAGILLVLIALVLGTAGGWIVVQSRAVGRQTSRVLAAEAERANDAGLFDRAMRYALIGARDTWLSPAVPAAETELARAAYFSRQRLRIDPGGFTLAAAFSADGQRIVSASQDRTARVWDAANGRELARLAHDGPVRSAAFSPDGRLVASGSDDGTVRLWDAVTGKEMKRLTVTGGVSAAHFSPDGVRLVTLAEDHAAHVWDVASGRPLVVVSHDARVSVVAFSPDGQRLITGSDDKTARIWDVASGRELARMLHEETVWGVTFSPDGTRVATASSDGSVRMWNAATGQPLVKMSHGGGVRSVAFSPDGQRLVTASFDKTAVVWDAATGRALARLPHEGLVDAAAFSPDGRQVLTTSDFTAHIWDASTGDATLILQHEGTVSSAAFSADGRVTTSSGDGSVRVWDVASRQTVVPLSWQPSPLHASARFSPDGRTLLTASDASAQVWSSVDGREVPLPHEREVTFTGFSADGRRIVTASIDHVIRIWDSATSRAVGHFTHPDDVTWAALDGHGERVATITSDSAVARVWDVVSGKEIVRVQHDKTIRAANLNADGTRLVTASIDGSARVWDVGKGTELARFTDTRMLFQAAFSADGRRVVTIDLDAGILSHAVVWDAATGAETARLVDGTIMSSAAFSADGRWVLTVGRNPLTTSRDSVVVRIWDASSGKVREQMPLDSPSLFDVHVAALSDDGQRLMMLSNSRITQVDVHWLAGLHGQELVAAVCREKLAGAKRLLTSDVEAAPLLNGRAGEEVCPGGP